MYGRPLAGARKGPPLHSAMSICVVYKTLLRLQMLHRLCLSQLYFTTGGNCTTATNRYKKRYKICYNRSGAFKT